MSFFYQTLFAEEVGLNERGSAVVRAVGAISISGAKGKKMSNPFSKSDSPQVVRAAQKYFFSACRDCSSTSTNTSTDITRLVILVKAHDLV